MIRNYTKQSRGFFIRVVAKIPMMTVLQYINYSWNRTIGQVKYALFLFNQRVNIRNAVFFLSHKIHLFCAVADNSYVGFSLNLFSCFLCIKFMSSSCYLLIYTHKRDMERIRRIIQIATTLLVMFL